MEEKDFASSVHDFLIIEGLLCLRFKHFSDMFIEFSKVLDSKNEVDVVSKCNYEGFEKRITKKKRSKRSKRKDFGTFYEAAVSKCNEGSKKSRKRKIKKERSSKSSKKKCKNNNNNVNDQLQEQPELPMEFKEKIEEMEGDEEKLVIEKELTKSDLNPNNGRLSIPKRKIQEKNFLTLAEESLLHVREGKRKRLPGISVSMLDPYLNLCDNMCFKKWEMETTEVYNITHGWNKLAAENLLRANDKVQLWSFRIHQHLYFALVKL